MLLDDDFQIIQSNYFFSRSLYTNIIFCCFFEVFLTKIKKYISFIPREIFFFFFQHLISFSFYSVLKHKRTQISSRGMWRPLLLPLSTNVRVTANSVLPLINRAAHVYAITVRVLFRHTKQRVLRFVIPKYYV